MHSRPTGRSVDRFPLSGVARAEGFACSVSRSSVATDAPADIKCPECDGPMKLRPGRWGKYFFGCNKYPKCKGTLQASPEMVEQLTGALAQT